MATHLSERAAHGSGQRQSAPEPSWSTEKPPTVDFQVTGSIKVKGLLPEKLKTDASETLMFCSSLSGLDFTV